MKLPEPHLPAVHREALHDALGGLLALDPDGRLVSPQRRRRYRRGIGQQLVARGLLRAIGPRVRLTAAGLAILTSPGREQLPIPERLHNENHNPKAGDSRPVCRGPVHLADLYAAHLGP
jgi:hypothetical protein